MAWALFIYITLSVPLSMWGAAQDTDGTGWRFFGFCFALWHAAIATWLWFHPTFWSPA